MAVAPEAAGVPESGWLCREDRHRTRGKRRWRVLALATRSTESSSRPRASSPSWPMPRRRAFRTPRRQL